MGVVPQVHSPADPAPSQALKGKCIMLLSTLLVASDGKWELTDLCNEKVQGSIRLPEVRHEAQTGHLNLILPCLCLLHFLQVGFILKIFLMATRWLPAILVQT